MTGASDGPEVITDAMQRVVGGELSRLRSLEVSEGDIRRWAAAVCYPELPPARHWSAAEITAPEDFNPFSSLCAEPRGWPPRLVDYAASVEGVLGVPPAKTTAIALNGSMGARYGVPIRPGDTITAVERLAGYDVVAGRRGRLLLTRTEAAWRNQAGELVKDLRRVVVRFVDLPTGPDEHRTDALEPTYPSFSRPGTLELWNRFGAANDELFEIHMDRDAARRFGADEAFGLGSQLVAYVHAAVREWLPDRSIRAVDCRLLDAWRLGRTVTIRGRPRRGQSMLLTGEAVDELDVHVVDSVGWVLAEAVAAVGKEER